MGGPYRASSLAAPFVSALIIYLFCVTDSERKAAFTCFTIIGIFAYLNTPSESGFDVFVMQSSAYLIVNGLALGVEGVVIGMLSNLIMGYMFMLNQQKLTPERDLHPVWQAYVNRLITEGMFMMFNLLKFSEALQRLEKADKLKTEFLCRMSHELRTPLSGIIGAIDILKFAPLTDEYVKLINIAKSCSTNLLQVINDILDFSKIEAGKMKLMTEKIKLRELVEETARVISPLLNIKKSVRFHLDVSPHVPKSIKNDKVKIKQILVNLLSNAIKFTNEGSITLRVDVDARDGINNKTLSSSNTMTKDWASASKFVQFSVTDTGMGIDTQDFESIFSAFEQASLKKNGQVVGGTGLGLNICLLLVKLMQGVISVKSDGPDVGSQFTFWIPVDDNAAATIAPAPKSETRQHIVSVRGNGTKSVLLVEDNPINQVVIKGQLQKIGCTVDVAANGKLAVEKLKLTPRPNYNWILLDLEMPVKDGITTVAELREMGIKTPIIALTAHAVEEKRTMALKAGMDDFLMKPCSIDTLKQCLDKHHYRPTKNS
eukprot:TRINITY_DN2881_c0_g3_i2.p1 TRINITY_DN2881_c0_g3~~TRINITY_DN2881_c0_g3_i2.p1  ORF type:complete len:608 (+),score=97.51 TRINITY_DN2881_c0_g3_i2:193-1824(+)